MSNPVPNMKFPPPIEEETSGVGSTNYGEDRKWVAPPLRSWPQSNSNTMPPPRIIPPPPPQNNNSIIRSNHQEQPSIGDRARDMKPIPQRFEAPRNRSSIVRSNDQGQQSIGDRARDMKPIPQRYEAPRNRSSIIHSKHQEQPSTGERVGSVKRPLPQPLQGSDCKRPRRNGDIVDGTENAKAAPNDAANETVTHIIFVIDFSGSMKEKDVNKNGVKISRWDAVFECMDTFLEDQIQCQSGRNKDDAIVIDDDESDVNTYNKFKGTVMVSVVIFNNEAKALLRHMPLVGDGQKVRKALETARKLHVPKSGTHFSTGFGLAKQLSSTNGSGKLLTEREAKLQNTVVVFLSDGRPGDLQFKPPTKASLPMQTTFRCNKKAFPAAGQHIEAMKEKHGDRFALHTICIYKEGKNWLKYLAERYEGNFHEPDLDMNDDFVEVNATIPIGGEVMGSDEDDEIIEMKVKSQDTLLRERHARAVAAGQIHSVHNTTTAVGSSMRSAFRSISSSVTAMRGGSRLQERHGVVFKETSPMIAYDATRMVLDSKNQSFTVPSGEKPNGRKVKVSMHPFAQGGLRNVYRMQQAGMPRQVAKESRHEVGYNERLRFHIDSSKCQARAKAYAKYFIRKYKKVTEMKELLRGTSMQMLDTEVIRLKDRRAKGGFRYLAVESEIKGKYSKWNSNNGYVNPSTCLPCQVAQAFSHFSYEHSQQKEMVVDIQGGDYTYTDPQLHSRDLEFGRADRGLSGIKDFFKTHKCNSICKALKLKDRSIEFGGVKNHLNTNHSLPLLGNRGGGRAASSEGEALIKNETP